MLSVYLKFKIVQPQLTKDEATNVLNQSMNKTKLYLSNNLNSFLVHIKQMMINFSDKKNKRYNA